MPDIDIERARRVLAAQPFSIMLKTKLLAFEPGRAELAVPIGRDARQHLGVAHGGLIASLADTAVTFAAGSLGGETVRTVDLTIHYLRRASGHELVARADVLHRGSRLIVARCDLFDRQDCGEIHCAAAQGTVNASLERAGTPRR